MTVGGSTLISASSCTLLASTASGTGSQVEGIRIETLLNWAHPWLAECRDALPSVIHCLMPFMVASLSVSGHKIQIRMYNFI